jgi:nucleotide-binding universal stress UspA family protein
MADLSIVGAEGAILAPMSAVDEDSAALVWAARIADQLERPLILLHVIHEPAEQPGLYRQMGGGDVLVPISELACTICQRRLQRLQSAYPESAALAEPRVRVVAGLPGRRIVEVAEEEQVALVVMGTNHRSSLDRLLHGSILKYVSRHSTRPVLEVDSEGVVDSSADAAPIAHYVAKAQALIGPSAAPL